MNRALLAIDETSFGANAPLTTPKAGSSLSALRADRALLAQPFRRCHALVRIGWGRTGVALESLDPREEPFVRGFQPHAGVDVVLDGTAIPERAGYEGFFGWSVRGAKEQVGRRFIVSGPRRLARRGGELVVELDGPVQPTKLSLVHEYGGISRGVPYVRNPIGKGFCTEEADLDGLALPEIEELGARLDPAKLLARDPVDPALPLPAWVGTVPRGVINRSLHGRFQGTLGGTAAATPDWGAPSHAAAPSSRLAHYEVGARVSVTGCGAPLSVELPALPPIVATVEGRSVPVSPVAQTLFLRPSANPGGSTVAVDVRCDFALPRSFLPGVHARIPIALHLLGETVAYEAPAATLREILRSGAVVPGL
jgi:hypothetical protein